eukprot:5733636-Amphidinium_carterae.2
MVLSSWKRTLSDQRKPIVSLGSIIAGPVAAHQSTGKSYTLRWSTLEGGADDLVHTGTKNLHEQRRRSSKSGK